MPQRIGSLELSDCSLRVLRALKGEAQSVDALVARVSALPGGKTYTAGYIERRALPELLGHAFAEAHRGNGSGSLIRLTEKGRQLKKGLGEKTPPVHPCFATPLPA